MMTRSIGVLATVIMTLMVTAGTALAGESYPPDPTDTTSVSGGGGTAFTGSDVSIVAIVAVTLLALGLAALFVARRRSAARAA
jgi:hypothetical protein